MLLELLSDFQISIPELGRIEARTHPVVLLTSNNTRELTEALKRRCLYLWLDYPSTEHELEIVRLHAPELPEKVAERLVEVIQMVRELDLKKPPSIAESIDWARALLLLGADDIYARGLPLDAVDHRQAPHRPRHRRRARRRAARASPRRRDRRVPGRRRRVRREPARGGPGGRDLGAARRLRGARRGRAGPRRPRSARRSPRRSPSRPRTGACSTSCSSASSSAPPRRPRCAQGVREQGAPGAGAEDEDGITGGEQIDYDNLREQLLQAIRDGDESAMRDLARLAIAAFGRRGEGSGVLGVDVQRIRRALGLRSEPGGPPPRDPDAPPPPALTRDQIRRFEQHLRRELERAQIERTQALPPSRPLNELDRALPSGPAAGPRRRAPRGRPAQAPARHPGPRDARAQAPRARRRAAHDARLAADRRRAGRAQVPPAAPQAPRALRAVRRLDLGHERVGVLPERAARAARRVPQDALVRVRRADLRGHRGLRARALLPRRLRRDLQGRGRRRRLAATPTTAACGASSSPRSPTTCTRARR